MTGNHVESETVTCIDRGKFSATTIDDETKIDNVCPVTHNVYHRPGPPPDGVGRSR